MNGITFVLKALALLTIMTLAACGGAGVVESATTEAAATVEPAVSPAETPLPATIVPTLTQIPPTVAPTETIPPPTEEPTATPESAYLSVPSVNCCRGRSLEPGEYEAPVWLGIPLSVEVGEGWKVLNEERALLFLLGRGQNVQNNPSQLITFINATNTSPTANPDRVIAAVKGAPEMTPLGEPVSVTVAGFPGLQLDSVALPNPTYQGSAADDIPPGVQFLPVIKQYYAPGFAWTTSSPEARVRTIALEVGDQTLVLYMEAPPDEFEQFVIDADTILQSFELIENSEP